MEGKSALTFDVLIVGSGHGGAHSAIALRQGGFTGSIGIVTAESDLPYERPPLSKEFLVGQKSFEQLLLRHESYWGERGIELLRSRAVEALDPAAQVAILRDGARVGYRSLVWAAGGAPRRLALPGHDLRGVHYLRARPDVAAIRADLLHAEHVVVIGGGYIGLEVAASLVKLGKRIVLLEALRRVLARVAG
ncbi:MAG: NAD(P)/FAD-dependent oxidoreductase, partial [Gammaproteobacteria bacterium]|nr:NAD(P)/FAD-dependent oxidoreductase [Gammaproteobacteria bacterium]